jgi:agmatine deiminase
MTKPRDTRRSIDVEPGQPEPLSRRRVFALSAASALALAGAGTLAAAPSAVRRAASSAAGWRIPGGFEPGKRVWLSFDAGHEALSQRLVAALMPHAPVGLLLNDEAAASSARESLATSGLAVNKLQFALVPGSFYFVRDALVFAQGPAGELGVIDFRWSHYGIAGWCARRHAGKASAIAACTPAIDPLRDRLDAAVAQALGARVFASDIAMEGGALESNGAGSLIANSSYLRQRNPGRSLAQLEAALKRLPGVQQVIWLPEGLAEDPQMRATITGAYVGWGTGGHTDEFVRFADARTVLLAWPDDALAAAHPVARLTRQRMVRNESILRQSRNAQGEPLRVLRVPMPQPVQRDVLLRADANTSWSEQWSAWDFLPREGRRDGQTVRQLAVASYLNFVNAGQAVLLPDYRAHGTSAATQARVQAVFEQAFPGRRLLFLDAISANWYGGGMHCATLNEP